LGVDDDRGAFRFVVPFEAAAAEEPSSREGLAAPSVDPPKARFPLRISPRYWVWGGAIAIVAAAGIFVGSEAAEKLAALRYRLQLLEARQESLGRLEAFNVVQEQAARGAAYLPAPRAAPAFEHGKWDKLGGPDTVEGWPRDYSKSKALAVHRNDLHVGLAAPNKGAPQIWRNDGERWERIGSAETIAVWARHTYVSAMISNGTTLFAGIDDTVWAFDAAGGWRQIGGEGRAGSWRNGEFSNAYSLSVHRGRLYAGMTGGGQAAVYEFADGRWEKIGGDGVRAGWSDSRYTGVYELWSHTDGHLYAGLIADLGPTAVYRYDGAKWEKIGGDGINGSWRNPGFTYAFSFASIEGRLVVAMNRHPLVDGNFTSIWAFDGSAWQPVGLGGVPNRWGEMHNYNAVANYRGRLVVGAGGQPAGNATLWALKEGRFAPVAGRGINGSWGLAEHAARDLVSRGNSEIVYRLVVWRGDLVVGFGDDPGMATVWRFRPPR